MGFWSSVTSGLSRAASGLSSAAKSVVSTAKTVCTKVKETASKVWNAVTGKDKFEEAERLHKQTVQRFEDKQRQYEEAVTRKSQEIERQITAINGYKKAIYNEQFPRFVRLGNRLHNVRVAGAAFEEYLGLSQVG